MSRILVFIFILIQFLSFSQEESEDDLSYQIWKNRLVLNTSLAYNTAPFSLKYDFKGDVKKLSYKANMNPVLGFGFAYKWMALNIGIKLPGYIKNTAEFGKTKYADIGFQFAIKKWYFNIDFHNYGGFSLKNADEIDPTLVDPGNRNQLRPSMRSASFSINGWWFKNGKFKMKPAVGYVGNYKKEERSFYLKSTINLHGVSDTTAIIPAVLHDPFDSKLSANAISALDFGVVPGYALINNIEGWQYGCLAGLGGVIQAKFYDINGATRGFLGLAPRLDLKIMGGYNVNKWFVMLTGDFDVKSFRFNKLKYRHIYYEMRVTAGYRFKEKVKKKKK